MTIRLSLDLNVLVADRLARRMGRRGTAASMLVDTVASGECPAGPVQLITSVPIIEAWADVLRRHFGFDRHDAEETAWILQSYAVDGPLGLPPQIVVGSGDVPFESETDMREAIRAQDEDLNKLFDEISDDRNILLAALAGRAQILATANLRDFDRGPAVRLVRDDVLLFFWPEQALVVARPGFVAHWLRQGIVPDHAFVLQHPQDFAVRS